MYNHHNVRHCHQFPGQEEQWLRRVTEDTKIVKSCLFV